MKRVFWFAVGAGVGVVVLVKARRYLQKAAPEAIGARLSESAASLGDSVREFADTVRAAMAEREIELRDALGPSPEPERD